MTTTPNDTPDPTAGIIAGIERMLAESRAIDTKKALEGIKANRNIRRNHRHSVKHRAFR